MQPVRVAVVGIGVMGADHAAILATSGAAELSTCCDIDPAAAGRVPPGVRFTTDVDAALATDGLEAVFICTPQAAHEDGIRRALARGLHVFCEKPVAHSLASADAIVALGQAHPGRLVIGHTYRFDPRWIALRAAVADGRLGRLVHLSATAYTPDHEGRMLAGRTTLANENSIHHLDLLQWLAGPVQRVYAEASRTGVTGEGRVDSLVATLRFASGAIGVIETDWALPTDTGMTLALQCNVVGSDGVAWIDGRGIEAGILSRRSAPSFPGGLLFRDPSGAPQGVYRVEDEFFLAKVRDGRPWPIDLPAARSALAVALAVDRSIETGRPVDVADLH